MLRFGLFEMIGCGERKLCTLRKPGRAFAAPDQNQYVFMPGFRDAHPHACQPGFFVS